MTIIKIFLHSSKEEQNGLPGLLRLPSSTSEFEKLKLDYPAVSEEQQLPLHQAGQQLLIEGCRMLYAFKIQGCPC